MLTKIPQRGPWLLGLSVSLGSVGSLQAEPARRVGLQMQWRHGFQYAGYYAAIEQGFYEAGGIELEMHPLPPDARYWQRVTEGAIEFGEMSASLALLRAKGDPVVLLAPIAQHSGAAIAVAADGPLDNIHDLHGKRIMIWDQAILLPAYLRAEGLEPGDYIRVPHNYDPSMLIEGKVDAMGAYAQYDGYYFDEAGFEVRYFQPTAGGIDFYGVCLYTLESTVEAEPEMVRAFREATLRGYAYALNPDNIDEMVELIRARYAPDLSADFLRHEARVFRSLVQPDYVRIGHVNPGRWHHTLDVLKREGVAPRDSALPANFFYDPDPEIDFSKYYRMVGLSAAIAALALAVAVPLFWLNRRLRYQVRRTTLAERTARERSAALQAAVEERERAMSILSHDLRQPLSGVQTFMEMLEDGVIDPGSAEGRDLVRDVSRSAGRTMRRLENLLQWIRNRHRRRKPVWQHSVDLRGLVDDCEETVGRIAADKNLRIEKQIPENLTVRADPNHLSVIVANLLHNAVKFSKAGGSIYVDAERNGKAVRLRIRDAGPGMSPEQLGSGAGDRALDDPNQIALAKGTGLGLGICRELLAEMNAALHLRNHPEGGLEVSFELQAGRANPRNILPRGRC